MPLVQIDFFVGSNPAQRRELVHNVTKAVAESLGVSETVVTVLLNEREKSTWARDGRLFNDEAPG